MASKLLASGSCYVRYKNLNSNHNDFILAGGHRRFGDEAIFAETIIGSGKYSIQDGNLVRPSL